ncbi:hypothetical protein V1264_024643 [Littorina saxatilis]|uniref:Ig-like domain-containing protein n=2 Tax=Littorina saxatilis TaxID=31220 RepID=A0AAN9AMJ2_9CAEN
MSFSILQYGKGTRIDECDNPTKSIDFKENHTFSLSCSNYSGGNGYWKLRIGVEQYFHRMGSCNRNRCYSLSSVANLTFLSPSSSKITLFGIVTTRQYTGITYYCEQTPCTVNILHSPDPPVISHSAILFPFLLGQTVTLMCNFSRYTGYPKASLSWQGQPEVKVSHEINKTLTLQQTDNGRKVVCEASSNLTATSNMSVETDFVLGVYYPPVITIAPFVSGNRINQCLLADLETRHCVVYEGQTVHFRCMVSSNPPPAEITWQLGNGSDSVLVIESASRDSHTGVYNCSATTSLGNNENDTRLPMTAWSTLTVIVMENHAQRHRGLSSGAAAGVTVAVVVVLVLAGLVVLWRRGWLLPCHTKDKKQRTDTGVTG